MTGAPTVPDSIFDADDPIAERGRHSVSAARPSRSSIRLGRSCAASKTRSRRAGLAGHGVYRVRSAGRAASPARRYRLRVQTPTAKSVTGIDARTAADVTIDGRADANVQPRSRHAERPMAAAAACSRAYAVRIESPFGPFFLFTDSTRLRLSATARNLFASDLQHVFIPGFRQDVLVAAVDSNFYDYYRTNNDPFTGAASSAASTAESVYSARS